MENTQISTVENMDTTPTLTTDNIDTAPHSLDTTPNSVEPFVTVKYNHQQKNYSLKEAADIIQKNMHYDSSIKKLQFLANSRGIKLPELVNEIFENAETKEVERLQMEFADDEAGLREALNGRKENFERAFLDMLKSQEEPSLNQRLADEYFELLEYFPDIHGIEEIPDEVLRMSAEKGKSLVLCFALHKAKEQAKLIKEAEQNKNNNLSSAPSLSSPTIGGEDPTILAMLEGLRK